MNQRHLIVGLAISVWFIYWLSKYLDDKKDISLMQKITLGVVLGLLGWVHTLLFVGICIITGLLCLRHKKFKFVLPVSAVAFILTAPRIWLIVGAGLMSHPIWNPGFLSPKPFGILTWINYWWLNLGLALILLPIGVYAAGRKKSGLFWAAFVLFIIANLFQFSYRIDHNHSLINLFVMISDIYIAYALYALWHKNFVTKVVVTLCLVALTASGFLDLMALKNDFRLRLPDAPANAPMRWIQMHTPADAIFLAPPQILDPVTLSGRYNYLGHSYYLTVMGYDTDARAALVKRYFETDSEESIGEMRKEGIGYVLLPNSPIADFSYKIHTDFWLKYRVYYDDQISIYRL